ncbi:RNA polymerase sigma factor [Pustulibacterium marinum]|uniref:RNA polymerase sigma factor n=1 Tax=Pustulibacterium marinum TaxID=1224947 RepID=UPI0011607883|nr:sigma-70 family RNA polymerase sigma factor [Pustulibacterium marinum]
MNTAKSDIILWKELKKGSTVALGSIYDMYIDELFLYGCKVTANTAIVEDAIHDLFLDLYKYHENLSDTSNIKFYLLSSLKNRIFKSPLYKEEKYQSSFQINKNVVPETSSSIEEAFIEEELFHENSKKIFHAMQLLPKKQREGVQLKYIQNKSYEEIAEIMNVKVETCRTIVYRGIKSLKEICVLFIGLFLSIW